LQHMWNNLRDRPRVSAWPVIDKEPSGVSPDIRIFRFQGFEHYEDALFVIWKNLPQCEDEAFESVLILLSQCANERKTCLFRRGADLAQHVRGKVAELLVLERLHEYGD